MSIFIGGNKLLCSVEEEEEEEEFIKLNNDRMIKSKWEKMMFISNYFLDLTNMTLFDIDKEKKHFFFFYLILDKNDY